MRLASHLRAREWPTVFGYLLFVVLLVLELAGAVPVLGGLFELAVAAVGVGAVVNTYFGLRRFEPVALPDADRGGPR